MDSCRHFFFLDQVIQALHGLLVSLLLDHLYLCHLDHSLSQRLLSYLFEYLVFFFLLLHPFISGVDEKLVVAAPFLLRSEYVMHVAVSGHRRPLI